MKVRASIARMVAGADSIDDIDLLGHAGWTGSPSRASKIASQARRVFG